MIERGALRIEVEPATSEGSVTVRLHGELDMEAAPLLQGKLIELVAGDASEVVVDLGDLSFMDSSGLQSLLAAAAHARAGEDGLRFQGAAGQVADLLRMTEVEEALGLAD